MGGWLAGMGLWRLIFFLNIPLSIVVFITMISKVPESKNPDAMRLDIWGAILVTLGLAGITFGFIESSKHGFGNPIIISSLIIGGIALIGFIMVQSYTAHPLMPLNLFKSSTFSGGNLLTLFVYAALGGAMFFLPLNLIQIQGYNELIAGVAMLPMIISIATISPFSGKFADRNGVRLPLIIGPLITGTGFYLFSTYGITPGPSVYWSTFFLSFLLLGIGMGITVPPLTTSVMGAISEDNSGIASGINNTVARAAGVLAIALLGALALFSFKKSMENEISFMDISSELKSEIMIESANFAAAAVPEGLSVENKVIVKSHLNNSFISAFNMVVYIGSLLCLLGSIMAFIFIKGNKPVNRSNP